MYFLLSSAGQSSTCRWCGTCGWYVHFSCHGLQQRVIPKYVVDRPLRSMRLRFLESYGSVVVVACRAVCVKLVSFSIGHAVIPFPEME